MGELQPASSTPSFLCGTLPHSPPPLGPPVDPAPAPGWGACGDHSPSLRPCRAPCLRSGRGRCWACPSWSASSTWWRPTCTAGWLSWSGRTPRGWRCTWPSAGKWPGGAPQGAPSARQAPLPQPAGLALHRNLILKMVVLGILCYHWLGRRVGALKDQVSGDLGGAGGGRGCAGGGGGFGPAQQRCFPALPGLHLDHSKAQPWAPGVAWVLTPSHPGHPGWRPQVGWAGERGERGRWGPQG